MAHESVPKYWETQLSNHGELQACLAKRTLRVDDRYISRSKLQYAKLAVGRMYISEEPTTGGVDVFFHGDGDTAKVMDAWWPGGIMICERLLADAGGGKLKTKVKVEEFLGLKVLRAQPENLLEFITDYLSSLLVTRENMYIAAQVCGTVCDCSCRPELEDELRFIGLDEESAKEAAGIIEEYFGQGSVKEEDLVLKLIKKTALNEDNLPDVLAAIRSAFLRHQSNKTHTDFESPPGSDDDQTEKAVKHTLALYKKTEPDYRIYSIMATKIQAAYRAYKVKRLVSSDGKPIEGTSIERSRVRFDTIADEIAKAEQDSESDLMDHEKVPSGRFNESAMKRLSSTSLAGSYINLPEHRPYSIQDVESYEGSEEEKPEKEHTNYFYTGEETTEEEFRQDGEEEVSVSTSDKRIPFYSYPVEETIEESESESIDESDVIDEDIVEEVTKIEEEVKEDIVEEIDLPKKGSDEKCTEEEPLEPEKYEEVPENLKNED